MWIRVPSRALRDETRRAGAGGGEGENSGTALERRKGG